MQTLFEIVSLESSPLSGKLLTADELAQHYNLDARKEGGTHLRPELQGQPVLPNLCGPMWGGHRYEDGEHVFLNDDGTRRPYGSQKPITAMVIRYETWPAYEAYSR